MKWRIKNHRPIAVANEIICPINDLELAKIINHNTIIAKVIIQLKKISTIDHYQSEVDIETAVLEFFKNSS